MLSFLSWKKTICHSIVLSLPSLRQHNQHHHYHHHHHLASWCEASWVSLAEYCEKLQQRRSRVARLCLCENFFKAGYIHLQPLWRTTKRSGLTKEWTKATWRETLGSRRRWIASWTLPSPRETSTSWRPSTPSSSWPGWRGRAVPRRSGRPPWSPGTSSPSPPPPAPSERCTPWCCSRAGHWISKRKLVCNEHYTQHML